MDAYGNLTDISEFSGNRLVRLISYMDEDIAIGGFSDSQGNYSLGVHRLSAGNPEQSVFVADSGQLGVLNNFALQWSPAPGVFMMWGGDDATLLQLETFSDAGGWRPNSPSVLTVDFRDGCWFALNNLLKNRVVDCSGSGTGEGNPIIGFPWNGGSNQIWRAATVGPGLGAESLAQAEAAGPPLDAGMAGPRGECAPVESERSPGIKETRAEPAQAERAQGGDLDDGAKRD